MYESGLSQGILCSGRGVTASKEVRSKEHILDVYRTRHRKRPRHVFVAELFLYDHVQPFHNLFALFCFVLFWGSLVKDKADKKVTKLRRKKSLEFFRFVVIWCSKEVSDGRETLQPLHNHSYLIGQTGSSMQRHGVTAYAKL